VSDRNGRVIGVLSTASLMLLSVVSFEEDLFGGMMKIIDKRELSSKSRSTCMTRCTHGEYKSAKENQFIQQDQKDKSITGGSDCTTFGLKERVRGS